MHLIKVEFEAGYNVLINGDLIKQVHYWHPVQDNPQAGASWSAQVAKLEIRYSETEKITFEGEQAEKVWKALNANVSDV